MTQLRTNSSPELIPSANDLKEHDGSSLKGASTNLTLLMKLIQDHQEAANKDDGSNPQRVAGMITILNEVRSQIEKSQLPKKPKLQKSSSENRHHIGAPPKRPHVETVAEENQRLRRELSASMTAQRSLGSLFSSLGREKDMIAAELARRVRELNEMDEILSDLRKQNERLAEKVKTCKVEHQEVISGQQLLIESLEGYWMIKRTLRTVQEEKARQHTEVAEKAGTGIGRLRGAFERMCRGIEGPKEVLGRREGPKEVLLLF